jgi:azurin
MYKVVRSIGLSSVLLIAFANTANASACDVNIEATAAMAFTLKEIAVPKSCKEITINFKNTGTMAKEMMGHNVVITKSSDMQAVVTDGMAAGLANNYVKPKDTRVIGYTAVIGGGQSTTTKVKLANLKPTESYTFFCSFPGHSGVMKGIFKLV